MGSLDDIVLSMQARLTELDAQITNLENDLVVIKDEREAIRLAIENLTDEPVSVSTRSDVDEIVSSVQQRGERKQKKSRRGKEKRIPKQERALTFARATPIGNVFTGQDVSAVCDTGRSNAMSVIDYMLETGMAVFDHDEEGHGPHPRKHFTLTSKTPQSTTSETETTEEPARRQWLPAEGL